MESPTWATDVRETVVPGPATCSGFHCCEPMGCQYCRRLPPGPTAAITVEFPTWATDGGVKVVPGPATCSGFHCCEPVGCQ